jgi:hypothetical protein
MTAIVALPGGPGTKRLQHSDEAAPSDELCGLHERAARLQFAKMGRLDSTV